MALIETLTFRTAVERSAPHKPVRCTYFSFQRDGKRFLQIDTYGTADRQETGTVSQCIQLDERSGLELLEILQRTFGSTRQP